MRLLEEAADYFESIGQRRHLVERAYVLALANVAVGGVLGTLFVGTLEPRKNVPGLIRGWVKACADRPDAPGRHGKVAPEDSFPAPPHIL
mgnify:CR=1 FL=1